ncbi:L,D-transpeptidase [Tenacibaculum sp. IB213877]|uniref:L,D-transpeptidase n=1 Tax=Tenacibaculum sp. IB213877 TaxID=3097351 RepID=UPI002A5A16E3|nr:L,D-transpeptidase [Tenacibaculum sp. IB213877]MDY0780888.1 L,D-transpeptidase [Tenacibaculum sp. IB213877]
MFKRTGIFVGVGILLVMLSFLFFDQKPKAVIVSDNALPEIMKTEQKKETFVTVNKHVLVKNYFEYIDSIVCKYDSLTPYHLTEHLLIRANPWIIDTLQNTDYYRMKERDSIVYHQKEMIVLPKNARLVIPDSIVASHIETAFLNTKIDINIPEFKLRIYEKDSMLFEFPVRVGRDEEKYLEMSGRVQDLKTITGSGKIVNHVKYPTYINPSNNKVYYQTKRDDNIVTSLPQIPFLETEINGIRNGQMIHPTTNPETLGRAYSNGCIGTKEADAWVIYYYAPIGTLIQIRYDLRIQEKGSEKLLKDIYGWRK